MSRLIAELARETAAVARAGLDERGERERALEEAEELTSNLGRFIAAAWRTIEPSPFVPGWHIDAICEHVELAYRGEIRRLAISVPPRSMKSRTTAAFAPAWWWTVDAGTKFLTASYADELAVRDADASRRIIQSWWYQQRFGVRFALTGISRMDRYYNDHGGYRIATSVGGTATGEGGDVLLVDDANKADDAYSPAALKKAREWWGSTWATRLNDLKTGRKILIGQRLHEDDLIGHVLGDGGTVDEGGDWVYLCLPAEYEPAHPFVWPDDPRTEPGELLWPNRVDRAALDELKREMKSPSAIAGQLQQRPAPAEGSIVKTAWWRYYDPAMVDERRHPFRLIVHGWDTAFKDKTTSDYVVGYCVGVAGALRYVLREKRGQWNLPTAKAEIAEMAAWARARFPAVGHVVLVENTANGPEIVDELRRSVPGILAVPVKGDKSQRLHRCAADFEAGQVLLPGRPALDGSGPDPCCAAWVLETVHELAAFPFGSHDDRVDALSLILNRLRGMREQEEAPPPEDPGRDGVHDPGLSYGMAL